MKVTQVSIIPSEAARAADRPALTPELLAACGARYSRSNDGLESILDRIDRSNMDKSVDSIFRMIDYGHQSIADMVPVAMFIDGVSIWLAYYIWTLCPTAGGQESSTRYIRLSPEGLIDPGKLGIGDQETNLWRNRMQWCFDAYQSALGVWEGFAARDPALARIPSSLLADGSEKAQRQVERMQRNYGFDRARYFLPVAAATNLMLTMPARGWVQLCQNLLSHPLPEATRLGAQIRQELTLSAPRLVSHAVRRESIVAGLAREFSMLQYKSCETKPLEDSFGTATYERPPTPFLDVLSPAGVESDEVAGDLAFHDNRYAWIGEGLRRTAVRFGWNAVTLAEIRDLNRHRTGTKYCPLIPQGFYCALDQVPFGAAAEISTLQELGKEGSNIADAARTRLEAGNPEYVYWTMLGVQYPFEHVTTADKFIYEAELRTGTGAHYRYAQHLRDVLSLWYERFPETRGLVLEGSAEPE